MPKNFKDFLIKIFISLLMVLWTSIIHSQECLSLGTSTWGNTANWNCGGVNRLPTCGDIVKIQSGHTVSVAAQYNLQGCGSAMTVDVTGILQFTNGNKLELPCGSVLSVQTGGIVRKSTAGGGSSTLISICASNVWTAGDGPLNGPISYGGEILPVQLLRFNAVSEQSEVELFWSTASEFNSDYFSIFKSSDGIAWSLVAEIKGSGTSNFTKDYSIQTTEQDGKWIYRLEQTDFDGTTEILSYVELNVLSSADQLDLNIFPNPSKDEIFIQGLPSNFYGELLLINLQGLLVSKTVLEGNKTSLNLNDLNINPGIYNAVVLSDELQKSFKLVYSN